MAKESAGLLLYRWRDQRLEVLLVHPGGPFWANKDEGTWSIPKGESEPGEDPETAARREVTEEIGVRVQEPLARLEPCRQRGGKLVRAWAAAADCNPASIRSNTVEIEWPPRSGPKIEVPEIDRAAWFDLDRARKKINRGQIALLDQLESLLFVRGNA